MPCLLKEDQLGKSMDTRKMEDHNEEIDHNPRKMVLNFGPI